MTFLGLNAKQTGACIALGLSAAGLATAYRRGYFDRFFDEWNTQESESSLVPVNRSQTQKVRQLPMTGPSGNALSGENRLVVLDDVAHAAAAAVVPDHGAAIDAAANGGKLVSDAASSAKSTTSSAISNAFDTAKSAVQRAAVATFTWVQENPKTFIVICGLLYALQYEYRTNRAHEHYEDQLRQQQQQTASSSLSTTTTSTSASSSAAMTRAKTYDGSTAARVPQPGDADFVPTSTWDTRARPSHVDPAFENLVKSLTPEQLKEYTRSLLGINTVPGKDDESAWLDDFTKQVRAHVLSVAPPKGTVAVLRGGERFRFSSSSPSSNNNDDDEDNDQLSHGDIIFAVDMLQRELKQKRLERKAAAAADGAASSAETSQ